jgi:pimeloyl-[acyl-carrier protein] methyl ester esterase
MLYMQQLGRGPNVMLLHGWGQHGGFLRQVAEHLMGEYCVTLVDLPGHGHSRMLQADRLGLDEMLEDLAAIMPDGVILVGWSLGGLLSMALTLRYPRRVRGLVGIAATPSFIQRPDWPHAMDREVLASFAEALQGDWQKTLNNFLALEVQGSDDARHYLRQLKLELFAHGKPDEAALRAGLEILRDTDLRQRLHEIHCPSLFVYGERDRLVPPASGMDIRQYIDHANVQIIDGAGHAPFISHFDIFMQQLQAFLLLVCGNTGEMVS